jgi:hypothetical protein
VVANNSALEEASQGLMPSAHPLAVPDWVAIIQRLLTDPEYLQHLQERIANSYQKRNWAEFARDFEQQLISR